MAFAAGRRNREVPLPVMAEAPVSREPPAAALPVTPAPSALDTAALDRAIREAVRAELAASAHDAQNRSSPDIVAKSAEAITASEHGHRIVASAVSARRWTRADADALRQSLEVMDAEDRDSVLAQLVPAVNRDEIKLEIAGGLF